MTTQPTLSDVDAKCDLILQKLESLATGLDGIATPASQEKEDAVLDFLDVCQILHISVRHLRRLQQMGDLTGFKIGRRRFYLSSEIHAYLSLKNGEQHH